MTAKYVRTAERAPYGNFRRAHPAASGTCESSSQIRDTAFRPTFGPNNNTFRMVDLFLVAASSSASVINPLGN
jgi:hypothetical protein